MAEIVYYYIKQQTDYYTVGVAKLIGRNHCFQVIYNKLILLSVASGGAVVNDTKLDFDFWLSSLLDENIEDIKKCLLFLLQINGVEKVTENELKVIGIEKLIGKRTNEAERKAKQREKAKEETEQISFPPAPELKIVSKEQVKKWFNEFYALYPRKRSRNLALETFYKKFEHEVEETAERRFNGLMATLNRYVAECEELPDEERKFIFCCHTFLNNEIPNSTVAESLERLEKIKEKE